MSELHHSTPEPENRTLTLTIDNRLVQVAAGATVLEGAQILHIPIPTLCYHEAVRDRAGAHGACRICMVEMSINKRGKNYNWLDAACVYPAEEGLVVQTQTPRVRRYRKMLIELLLAKAPDADILHTFAKEYGADKTRFPLRPNSQPACILCGLCTLVCNEVVKNHAIGLAYRGIDKQIVSPFDISHEACLNCQACAYVCPTGAIKSIASSQGLKPEAWVNDKEAVKCVQCQRPFVPMRYYQKLKDLLKERNLQIKEEILALCPDCRRRELRSAELLSLSLKKRGGKISCLK